MAPSRQIPAEPGEPGQSPRSDLAVDTAAPSTAPSAAPATAPKRARGGGIRGREGIAGWVFVSPLIIILGLFLVIPIFMALYVSLTNWQGNGSPFTGGEGARFVGAQNYLDLFAKDGLTRSNFMQSIGNTFYYVLLVVPLQTILALSLALFVNNKMLKAKGFFRTAFYFPSVTSSIAIATVFLFLFSNGGAVNAFLRFFGLNPPQWFSDSRGLLHIVFGWVGIDNPAWAQGDILGRSLWDWLSGPSVLCASSSSSSSGLPRAPSC